MRRVQHLLPSTVVIVAPSPSILVAADRSFFFPRSTCKRDNRPQDAWRKCGSHAYLGRVNTGYPENLTRPGKKIQVPVLQQGLQQERAQEPS